MQTTNRKIFAAGDVCFEHTLTHVEDASARIVVENALFSGRKKLSALAIPWCIYTDPEIAHVGMYVPEARAKSIPVKFRVTDIGLGEAASATDNFVTP